MPHIGTKMFFEVKIEKSEKAASRWELNPGHLACAANVITCCHPFAVQSSQASTDTYSSANVCYIMLFTSSWIHKMAKIVK